MAYGVKKHVDEYILSQNSTESEKRLNFHKYQKIDVNMQCMTRMKVCFIFCIYYSNKMKVNF